MRLGTAGVIGVMGDPMAFSCRNCGKPQNRPGLKFCPDCGQPISGAVLPDTYRPAAPSGLPGPRRVGLLAALMVMATAIAVAGGAGALTGLLRSPPTPARLSKGLISICQAKDVTPGSLGQALAAGQLATRVWLD